jgi:hypothetical protein
MGWSGAARRREEGESGIVRADVWVRASIG